MRDEAALRARGGGPGGGGGRGGGGRAPLNHPPAGDRLARPPPRERVVKERGAPVRPPRGAFMKKSEVCGVIRV